jgi:hypothetical protein
MSDYRAINDGKDSIDRSKINQPTQSVADKVLASGRDAQAAAMEIVGASADALKSQASQLKDAAQDVAAEAGQRLQEKVAEQKGVGADYVDNLADTMRRAAGEFDADVPLAATYIRKAASQVESAANALREGNLTDLVQGAQTFARNQPTAFLGLAVLAGFGVVRFIKSAPNPAISGGENLSHAHTFEESR